MFRKVTLALIAMLSLFAADAAAAPGKGPRYKTLHVFAVAVGEQPGQNPLPAAPPTTAKVTAAMQTQRGLLAQDVKVHSLVNQDATKAKIEARLAALKNEVAEGDGVILYFCGHGGPERGLSSVMPSWKASPATPTSTATAPLPLPS
jgi:hypothetical protein